MESVEVSAKTVDDAIEIALEELGLRRSQANIEVLTPGKPGLFGLGGEQARVRVTALDDADVARPAEAPAEMPEDFYAEPADIEVKDIDSPEVDLAADYLRSLLDLLGIPATILPEIRPSSEAYGEAGAPLAGVPVASALGDQSAPLVGQTCFDR